VHPGEVHEANERVHDFPHLPEHFFHGAFYLLCRLDPSAAAPAPNRPSSSTSQKGVTIHEDVARIGPSVLLPTCP
jgi:hypothetical protein